METYLPYEHEPSNKPYGANVLIRQQLLGHDALMFYVVHNSAIRD